MQLSEIGSRVHIPVIGEFTDFIGGCEKSPKMDRTIFLFMKNNKSFEEIDRAIGRLEEAYDKNEVMVITRPIDELETMEDFDSFWNTILPMAFLARTNIHQPNKLKLSLRPFDPSNQSALEPQANYYLVYQDIFEQQEIFKNLFKSHLRQDFMVSLEITKIW